MKTVILLLLSLSVYACAQKVKPKNLQFATYEMATPDRVEVDSYASVDENGKLNVYLDTERGKTFYAYQLTPEEIKKVNILDRGTPADFVERKQLQENHFYAGSKNYLSFEKNGKQNKLCYILPFMDAEFVEVANLLQDKIFAQQDSARISEFSIDFQTLEQEIAAQNRIDNYLPQKQLPPPPMSPRK